MLAAATLGQGFGSERLRNRRSRLITWKQLIIIGLAIVGLLIIWLTRQVLAAAFLGLLLGVVLQGLGSAVHRRFPLPRRLVSAATIVLIVGGTIGAGWLLSGNIIDAIQKLDDRLPTLWEETRAWLDEHPWADRMVSAWTGGEGMSDAASGLASGAVGALGGVTFHAALVLIVVVVMVFTTLDPVRYRRGLLLLAPSSWLESLKELLQHTSRAMRYWMLGRVLSMVLVAMLTSLGLWLIGMPAAIGLGLIAGLLSFVPNLGPILSVVPGVLLAAPYGWSMVGLVLLVYYIAQLIESNAITPLMQQHFVSVPAAWLIVVQAMMALLAGVWGLLVATPLVVVCMVAVQQLYIRDRLGKDVSITGDRNDDP